MFRKWKAKVSRFAGFGGKGIFATALAIFLLAVSGTSVFAATTDPGVDMTGVAIPFTVGGMLSTATNFLSIYGQWVLLVLGVIFTPVLYGLILRLVTFVKKQLQPR